jgi:nitrite reductase (NADH) small subunit
MTDQRHRVGSVDEFALDDFRIVRLGGREIGVVRTAAGFFAIRNACPHRNAPLCRGRISGTMLPAGPDEFTWGRDGEFVRCPWHMWEFELRTGNAAYGITDKRVAVYPVEVDDDDEVYVVLRSRGRSAAGSTA